MTSILLLGNAGFLGTGDALVNTELIPSFLPSLHSFLG